MTILPTGNELTHAPHFNQWPKEVAAYVFSFLPVKSLVTLREVDRGTAALIKELVPKNLEMQLCQQSSLSLQTIQEFQLYLSRFTKESKSEGSIVKIAAQNLTELDLMDLETLSSPPPDILKDIFQQAPFLKSLAVFYKPPLDQFMGTYKEASAGKLQELVLCSIGEENTLQDEHIREIVSVSPMLSTFKVEGSISLTDVSTELIKALPLKNLILNGSLNFSQHGMLNIFSIPTLEHLELAFQNDINSVPVIPANIWQNLSKMPHLRHLSLLGLRDPQIIEYVSSNCAQLTCLHLINCDLDERKLPLLSSIPNLAELDISENSTFSEATKTALRALERGEEVQSEPIEELINLLPHLKIHGTDGDNEADSP